MQRVLNYIEDHFDEQTLIFKPKYVYYSTAAQYRADVCIDRVIPAYNRPSIEQLYCTNTYFGRKNKGSSSRWSSI